MAKPELGNKRICVSCAAKFYDLLKTPAVCPKCDTEQPPEQPRVRRGGGNVMDEKRRAKVLPVPGVEGVDVEVETDADVDVDVDVDVADDDADEDVLDDTSDLEDAADAIIEVEVEGHDEER